MPIVHEPEPQQTPSISGETILTIKGLRYNYPDGHVALRGVSLQLECGEKAALVGPNGSGKSTLLRVIAGLVRPTTGRVEMFFKGESIAREARRRFVGMVAPAFSLYEELTALENLEFFCKVRGIAYDRNSCLGIMRQIGLSENAGKLCRNYSSGMKQRLKLAQALLHKPPLLLLDASQCRRETGVRALCKRSCSHGSPP